MAELRIVGQSRPIDAVSDAVPAKLRALLVEHGEGLLAGQLVLSAPGSERHARVVERYDACRRGAPLGWSWLSSEGIEGMPLGEAEKRGFLVEVRARIGERQWLRPRLWFCHAWGGVFPVGNDLDDVARVLVEGMIVDLDLRCERGEQASKVDATAAFGLEATYDVRTDDVGARLRDALASGDGVDAAFEAFMERGLSVDRIGEAESIAAAAGARGDDLRDTIRIILRRNAEMARLAALRSAASPLDSTRSAIAALGVHGTSPPDAGMLQVTSALRPNPSLGVLLEGALAGAKRMLSQEALDGLLGALAACSPEDVFAFSALLADAMGGGWQKAPKPWLSTIPYSREINLCAEAPWASVGPLDRLWPVAALLLFAETGNFSFPCHAMWRARAAALVPVLDGFLANRPFTGCGLFRDVALLRTKNQPLGTDDLAWIAGALDRLGPIPEKEEGYGTEGLMSLLAFNASLDGAVELLSKHATRNATFVLEGAKQRGDDATSRALLERLWSEPKRFHEGPVFHACKLAAEWGDAKAKRALPAIERRLQRAMNI
ncbi:MAG: hypothetical protein QM702_21265 [Rubrivivax sp.]